jgi:hypothetical protein
MCFGHVYNIKLHFKIIKKVLVFLCFFFGLVSHTTFRTQSWWYQGVALFVACIAHKRESDVCGRMGWIGLPII